MIKFKLKEVLTEKQKSMYWLMQATGKSFQSLTNLTKSDLSGIHFDTLELLCNVLDVTPAELIELKNNKKKGVKLKNEQTTKAI